MLLEHFEYKHTLIHYGRTTDDSLPILLDILMQNIKQMETIHLLCEKADTVEIPNLIFKAKKFEEDSKTSGNIDLLRFAQH